MDKKIAEAKKLMTEEEVLAKTLYFEAGCEEIFDILMVGWVIRNRVKGSKWYGNDYIEVCLKRLQFSCWNKKSAKQISCISMTNWKWAVCKMVAEYIMRSSERENPLPGVHCYYNPMLCSPKWARKMKMVVPLMRLDHIFLK